MKFIFTTMEASGATAQSCPLIFVWTHFLHWIGSKHIANMTFHQPTKPRWSTEILVVKHHPPQRLMPQSAGAIAAFMDVTLSHFPHSSPYSKSWKEWHLSGAHHATISVYHVINLQKKGNADSVSEVLPWKHPLNMRSVGAAIIHCSKMKGQKNLLPSLHNMKPGGCWLQSKGYSYKHVYIYTFVYCNIHSTCVYRW